MTNQPAVIPSEVEESRGESFKVIPRDHSTSLRMTVVRGGIHHSFDVRYSDFVLFSGSAHSGNFRQTQDPFENLIGRRVLDVIHSNCICNVEAPGFRSPQRFQMRAATERFADVVGIGTNIKAFAAQHGEIDFG